MQWTSPAIQNELLEIMADLVLLEVAKDVKTSEQFGVIVDGTADISRIDQVAICLRYVKDCVIREAFIGFYPTETTEGSVLCDLVKKALSELSLDPAKITGIRFDGAANMSGIHRGLATLMMKLCSPRALYVHCYGHLLNLAIQDTMTDIVPLRNTLGTIQKINNFLEASPKRHAVLHNIKHEGKSMEFTLKSQSVTRWSCRHEAVKAVDQELPFIIKALLLLADEKDPKTAIESKCLLISMCDFNIIFGLLLKIILSNTASLSRYLQGNDIDVASANTTATATIGTLSSCRQDEHFDSVWLQAEQRSNQIISLLDGTRFDFKEAAVPRKIKQDVKGYHRVTTYFASLDKVIVELNSRFSGNDQDVLCALSSIVLGSSNVTGTQYKLVLQQYGIDEEILKAERSIFYHDVGKHNMKCVSDVLEVIKDSNLSTLLPVFSTVTKILGSIPATSCSAERSFSGLRRMKTYLRSTTGQARLRSISVLNIERQFSIDCVYKNIDKVIDLFGSKHGRQYFFF